MSLTSLMGVAQGALAAQTAAITVTGENVANATTPGYVRREARLEANAFRGGLEGGVTCAGLLRRADGFAQAKVLGEWGKSGGADARLAALQGAQNVLAPGDGQTIGDRLSAFFSSLTTLAGAADDPSARAQVLARADALGQSFSDAAAGLGQERQDLLQQANGVAGEINERLKTIATLNQRIADAQAAGDPAPDLRDRRDVLVGEVGQRVGVQVVDDPSGRVTLLAAGSTLVDGDDASTVGVGVDATGALKLGVTHPGGATVDVTSKLTSGTLGGLRTARDTDVPALQQKLDQLAFDVSTAVNAKHAAGFGLDGGTGRPLFATTATPAGAAYSLRVDPALVGHPERLAASSSAATLPGGNDVALALAGLATTSVGGSGSPIAGASSLLASAGQAVASAQGESALRADTTAQARALADQSSGVSIDDEMVKLTQFQRGFEAATKVFQTADELLRGLLQGL